MIYAEVVRCFDALHWTRSFLRVEFVDKNSVFFGWAAVRLSKSLRFNWSNFQRFLFWFDAHNILNIQSVGIPQKSHIWPTHLRHLTMFITASQSKMDWIHQPDRVDLSLGTRDSQYVTLVKNAYFVIADSLGCKWSVAPAFLFLGVCNEHPALSLFAQTSWSSTMLFEYFTFFNWRLKLAMSPLRLDGS